MASPSDPLRQGCIVWARVTSPNGQTKTRPVVILTPDDEIGDGGSVVDVFVTTTYPAPPPSDHVELPWSAPFRHPATRLARRSAAVCSYLVVLSPRDIDEVKGYVPGRTFLNVLETVRRLHPDADPLR